MRCDTDDFKRLSVEAHRASEHAGILLIVRLPVGLCQHHDPVSLRNVILCGEESSHQRSDPQDLEHVRRGAHGRHARRRSLVAKRRLAELPQRQMRECRRVLLEVEVLHDVARHVVEADFGERVVDFDDPRGLAEGQRPDHQGVEHREDGGVGADAQGQRQQRGCGEALVLEQCPPGKSQIRAQAGHPARKPSGSIVWSGCQAHIGDC